MVELRVRVGQKGHILIPKFLREKYGVENGGNALIEAREDGILVRGRPSPEEAMVLLREHARKVEALGVKSPRLGELKKAYLEMEFEEAHR